MAARSRAAQSRFSAFCNSPRAVAGGLGPVTLATPPWAVPVSAPDVTLSVIVGDVPTSSRGMGINRDDPDRSSQSERHECRSRHFFHVLPNTIRCIAKEAHSARAQQKPL